MIKLYGARMGSSLRAHWALEEAGVEYEVMPLNLREGEHKKPDFLKLNPTGQIPVIVDGDFVLSESMAISSYVAEKYKAELLGDSVEARAQAWKWSIWSYLNLQKHFGTIFFQMNFATEKDEEAIAKAGMEVKPYLVILNDHLAKHKHIAGEHFSLADINAGVAVSYGMGSNFDMSAFPHIAKWYGLISARPAFLKATGK